MTRRSVSVWARTTLTAAGALVVTLLIVVVSVYEFTLLRGRAAVDDILRVQGDQIAADLIGRLTESSTGAAISIDDLVARAADTLAAHPGSDEHMSAVRVGDRMVWTAAGPAPLVERRAEGDLVPAATGTIRSLDGVRSRGLPVVLGAGPVVVVETHGDDAEVTGTARAVAIRVAVAAAAAGVIGLAVMAVGLRRSTRPLHELSTAVLRARLDDLSPRVPVPARDDEIATLARDVNAMFDELHAARRAKDELVASASHELRTPIAVARGHLELLQQARSSDPAASLSQIDAELTRLTRLVEDLLALARAGDRTWLRTDVIEASHVFDELERRTRALGGQSVLFDPAPAVSIECDLDRVLQALSNLVLNALVHTPAGTHIVVSATLIGDTVQFTVADDGPGLPPEVRSRAGEAFVRGSADGSGLGLAVVRAIALAHGGSFRIDDAPRGTRAVLTLPVDRLPSS